MNPKQKRNWKRCATAVSADPLMEAQNGSNEWRKPWAWIPHCAVQGDQGSNNWTCPRFFLQLTRRVSSEEHPRYALNGRMTLKTTTAIMAVFVTAGLGHSACCDDIHPPLRVVDGLFQITNVKTLGLETIPSERVEVFHANEKDGTYSHHPGLTVFQGHLYCSWSNGKEGHEDYPGQRVLYARSADGMNWSQHQVLMEPGRDQDCCVAAGFHVVGSTLVAYYTVKQGLPAGILLQPDSALFARTSHDGKGWSQPRRITAGSFMEAPRHLPGGRLLLGGERVGELRKTRQARMRLLYSDDPGGLENWMDATIAPENARPIGADVFRWTEPCPFVRPDGVIVSPFRNTSGFLYASISRDNGVSWSVPQKTNFPDSRARFCTGRLPDGTIYLISNPGPGPDRRRGTGKRHLLTIALSSDGIVFDRAWLVHSEPTRPRFSGKGKSAGWQYPNALVWKNELYISCSVNKEDVGLIRIALENLK
jgi:hypothetical protein